MSAPATVVCAFAAVALGLPVLFASHSLETQARAAAAADSAALAAADAASGWSEGDPCEAARTAAKANRVRVTRCDVSNSSVRITVADGRIAAKAHAGWSARAVASADGKVGENGWAWPSDVRAITQGLHDGTSIDLAVSSEGALYAPYGGVVVSAGHDGGGVPGPCLLAPSWWHGPNVTVIIRHRYKGQTLYSSHNHIEPGSPARFGIEAGSMVRAGQRVATAGMSGCTSGPHTHFTLASTLTNSMPDLDPFRYLGDP